ncbi:MAG TPA: translesion DNA synthesis-associated protein ImuA [Solimonas sp.]
MSRAAALQAVLRDARLWRGDSAAPLRAEATGHATLDAVLPGGGWPLGALSEILHARPGVGELGLALPLLARLTRAKRHVAFVAPPFIPYAPALANAGVALRYTLVVEPRDTADALWSAEQLLHAQAGAVLLWQSRIDTTALRKLQLAAEGGGGIGLLYRPIAAANESSVAGLRLRVAREEGGASSVEVLKCRGLRPPSRYALAA